MLLQKEKTKAENCEEVLLDTIEKAPVIKTQKSGNDKSKSKSKQVINDVRENLDNSLESCSNRNVAAEMSPIATSQQSTNSNETTLVVPPRPPNPGGKDLSPNPSL